MSDTILAIDPGPTESAYVVFEQGKPVRFAKVENEALKDVLWAEWNAAPYPGPLLVIEQIAAMGMAVGAEVFETVFWSGRMAEQWQGYGGRWDRLKRHAVKMALCGNMRAKDANIRTALLDKYGPGKEIAVGRKANPGPLYGMAGDCWAALALAVAYSESPRLAGTGET